MLCDVLPLTSDFPLLLKVWYVPWPVSRWWKGSHGLVERIKLVAKYVKRNGKMCSLYLVVGNCIVAWNGFLGLLHLSNWLLLLNSSSTHDTIHMEGSPHHKVYPAENGSLRNPKLIGGYLFISKCFLTLLRRNLHFWISRAPSLLKTRNPNSMHNCQAWVAMTVYHGCVFWMQTPCAIQEGPKKGFFEPLQVTK